MITFKEFLVEGAFEKLTLKQLGQMLNSDNALRPSVFQRTIDSAFRDITDHKKIEKAIISSLLHRLKDSEGTFYYRAVKKIIQQIKYAAERHPTLNYPELDVIERTVDKELSNKEA